MDERKLVELARLEAFVEGVLGAHPAVSYEPAIAFALSAHRHVAEIAASRRVDLIVAADPRGPVRRRLFSGLAGHIQAMAPCPVVIVNREARSSLLTVGRRLASPAGIGRQLALLAGSASSSSSRT